MADVGATAARPRRWGDKSSANLAVFFRADLLAPDVAEMTGTGPEGSEAEAGKRARLLLLLPW